jgi:regulatory protein
MINIIDIIKRKNGTYDVVLSDHQIIKVTEKTLGHYHLYVKKELDEALIESIKTTGNIDIYTSKAMHYMSYKLRTTYEVKQYLKKKGLDERDIDVVIEQLHKEGLLDDQRYASLIVDEWMHFGLNGPKLIKQKLRDKGIPSGIIDASMLEYTLIQQKQQIIDDLEKTSTVPIRKPYYKAIDSLTQKYLRKGFDLTLIKDVFTDESVLLNQCIDEMRALSHFKRTNTLQNKSNYEINQLLTKKGFSTDAKDAFHKEDEDE